VSEFWTPGTGVGSTANWMVARNTSGKVTELPPQAGARSAAATRVGRARRRAFIMRASDFRRRRKLGRLARRNEARRLCDPSQNGGGRLPHRHSVTTVRPARPSSFRPRLDRDVALQAGRPLFLTVMAKFDMKLLALRRSARHSWQNLVLPWPRRPCSPDGAALTAGRETPPPSPGRTGRGLSRPFWKRLYTRPTGLHPRPSGISIAIGELATTPMPSSCVPRQRAPALRTSTSPT
jgi:hypothetical protein